MNGLYDIVVPVQDQSGNAAAAVHLLVPESRLDERVTGLCRSLITNVFMRAGLSLLVLVVGFLYVLRMLHRTRQLEAEAQMADRLAYVGTLAGGLARQIRNPLNAMNMNVQMLQEELEDAQKDMGTGPGVYRPAGDQPSGDHAPGTPGLRLSGLCPAPAACVLRASTRPPWSRRSPIFLSRPISAAAGWRWSAAWSRSYPGFNADPGQLKQALINVMINAADAVSEDRGTVEITASPHGEDGVAIAVADNGGTFNGFGHHGFYFLKCDLISGIWERS